MREEKKMLQGNVKDNENQKKLSTVMKRTEQLLTDEPATRNSDKLLIVRYLNKYHGVNDIHDILCHEDIPSFESIRRSRQRIQADGRCISIEPVSEGRNENQASFLRFFGRFRRRHH
jgi:hypothetical protein